MLLEPLQAHDRVLEPFKQLLLLVAAVPRYQGVP